MEKKVGTSFYGGVGGGITSHDVDKKINNNNKQVVEKRIQQHVIVSNEQPESQTKDDYWFVLSSEYSDIDEETVIIIEETDPNITCIQGHRYICGEVDTINITPSEHNTVEVIFTSGSTPALLTLPNTVLLPSWFDKTDLEANVIYDIIITDGIYGAVMLWG